MTSPTRTLTRSVAAGDREAFARLYDRYFDLMYAEARRRTGRDEAFCLDVVQDAMLRMMKSIHPFEHEPQLVTWLKKVVHSAAVDRIRAETRRRRRERAAVARGARPAPEDQDEQLAWLRGQLAAAQPGTGELLLDRFKLGRTLEQVGTAHGCSASAADGRIRRLISTLQHDAKEHFDDR